MLKEVSIIETYRLTNFLRSGFLVKIFTLGRALEMTELIFATIIVYLLIFFGVTVKSYKVMQWSFDNEDRRNFFKSFMSALLGLGIGFTWPLTVLRMACRVITEEATR